MLRSKPPDTIAREGRRHRRLVVPDEGVVVERIGDGDQRPERRLDACAVRIGQRREPDLPALGAVGHDRGLAAGAAHRRQPPARQRPDGMQQLQRFEEGRDRIDAGDAEPFQEGVRGRVRTCQRGGMRDRRGARLLGAADLHRDDRLAQLARPRRQPLEAGDAVEALDMQAERRDAVVLDQAERHFRQAGLRLVAGRHQEGDRQAALLHGQVAGDVGRLRDDADAARRPAPAARRHAGPATAARRRHS